MMQLVHSYEALEMRTALGVVVAAFVAILSISIGPVWSSDLGTIHSVKKRYIARWHGNEPEPGYFYSPVRYYAYAPIVIYKPYPYYDAYPVYSPYQLYYSRYYSYSWGRPFPYWRYPDYPARRYRW